VQDYAARSQSLRHCLQLFHLFIGIAMADVFISYSKNDATAAKALAEDLIVVGFTVWWDTQLSSGDDFHEAIRAEIAKARAVIVIWSPAATSSSWVRGEADEAARLGTLISTHVEGFDPRLVPINHSSIHCVPVTDRQHIFEAVERKGKRDLPEFDHGLPEQMQSAAEQGDTTAMCYIAILYSIGHGVPKDAAKAALWYETAAAYGNANAMCNIACHYESGDGVSQDYGNALRWYEKAAANGDTEAMLAIAGLYKVGKAVPLDISMAIKWYRKAQAGGNPHANTYLANLKG
jgi:hypothetical protein